MLSPGYPHTRDGMSESRAIGAAKSMLESRGNAPRLLRNTLVFLAADETRLQDLEEGVSLYLAWQSILADKETLDLPPHQVRQAESQRDAAASAVEARIGETYQWLLVPAQRTAQADVEWRTIRLTEQGPLAGQASRRMHNDDLLVTSFAAPLMRMELDRVPLWRGDHVAVQQLLDDFARYLYLPRLKEPSVLLEAARNGLALMTWQQDSFASADSYDESAGRYRGLRSMQLTAIAADDTGLIVRPEVARRQMDAEAAAAETTVAGTATTDVQEPGQTRGVA